jgi:hypothetical protein
MWPRLTALPKPALAFLAVAFFAVGTAVQASARHGHARHQRRDRGYDRFGISGRVAAPLWPGATQPVEITLSNRVRHVLWISGLKVTVAVDAAHVAAGCSASRDYFVTQLPREVYPIRLEARSPYTPRWPATLRWPGTRGVRLSDLGVPLLPAITMLNLPTVDQDGCKGASLQLRFWATSRLHPPYVRLRAPVRRAP